MAALVVIAHVLIFLAGIAIVLRVLKSAVQTFVLPRGVRDQLARFVFVAMRALFDIRVRKLQSYADRDGFMALYAPVTLLALLLVWLSLMMGGYMLMFWSLGESWHDALKISGSSLLTLGFATGTMLPETFLTFSEAGIGVLLAALLVAYLPTIYGAWQRREQGVATLETRAGSPPSAWEMIIRYRRLDRLEAMGAIWPVWEAWFIDIEESHTSLSALNFFRSPQPDRSWITAAGVVLDAAALMSSAVDVPRDPQRELCIRGGYIALRRIAAFFRIPFDADPPPDAPISVTRQEFDDVCDLLAGEGVAMKPGRDEAWQAFSGWRVNYDAVLLGIAALTMAPYAPWVSDRSNWRLRQFVLGRPLSPSQSAAHPVEARES